MSSSSCVLLTPIIIMPGPGPEGAPASELRCMWVGREADSSHHHFVISYQKGVYTTHQCILHTSHSGLFRAAAKPLRTAAGSPSTTPDHVPLLHANMHCHTSQSVRRPPGQVTHSGSIRCEDIGASAPQRHHHVLKHEPGLVGDSR
jgi:hypothetical protein